MTLSKEYEKVLKETKAGTLQRVKKFRSELPVLSTGIDPLDLALGAVDPIEGLPGVKLGDVLEIMGENNSYKTGTWEHFARATIQRYGPGSVVGLFSEPPEVERLEALGVNPEDIISIDCYHEDASQRQILAAAALASLIKFCALPEVKLVVIDSIGNLTTESELYEGKGKERELGDNPVAAQAKVINHFMKSFSSLSVRPTLCLVNYYREQIQTGFSFLRPMMLTTKSPGGRGKEFMSWIRVLVSSTPLVRETNHSVTGEKVEYGRLIKYTIFKNKNFKKDGTRTVRVEMDFSKQRLDNEEILLKWATFFSYKEDKDNWASLISPVVFQSGSWINIGKEKFQGTTKAANWLRENPELKKALLKELAKPSNQMLFWGDEKPNSEAILDED